MDKKSNDKLNEFDPTNASVEQIRKWLYAIIEAELEKNEAEIDYELIQECSDLDAYLLGEKAILSSKEYEEGIATIKYKSSMSKKGKGSSINRYFEKKHRQLKILIAIAATLTLIFGTITVTAAFHGMSIKDFISENIKKIVNMNPGDKIDETGVTLIKGDKFEEYASLENALQDGGIRILYPTVLPNDVNVEKIILSHAGDESRYDITFVFNSDSINYAASNYLLANVEEWESYEIYMVGNIPYYIIQSDDGSSYQAVCQYNGYEYNVSYSSYEGLINILDNIKELEK